MSRLPAPSCWLVALLVAALAWPAAAADAATFCGPADEAGQAACADECAAACGGCCDEEREAPHDPDPPADDETPGGCCDDVRSCCGAAQAVSAPRGASWGEAATPSGFLRPAHLDVRAIDASLGLLRPPRL